jgi:hypothetical protein
MEVAKPYFALNKWYLFNAKGAMFLPYHDENKLHLMRWWWCPLCIRPTHLVGISASSLKQQSADRHVAPLGHIIYVLEPTSICSYPSKSCWVLSREAKYACINIIVFGLTLPASTVTIAQPMWFFNCIYSINNTILSNFIWNLLFCRLGQ